MHLLTSIIFARLRSQVCHHEPYDKTDRLRYLPSMRISSNIKGCCMYFDDRADAVLTMYCADVVLHPASVTCRVLSLRGRCPQSAATVYLLK